MCRAMEEMRAEAEQRKAVIDIKNLMKNMKWPLEQALAALGIAASEQEKYRRLVMA